MVISIFFSKTLRFYKSLAFIIKAKAKEFSVMVKAKA